MPEKTRGTQCETLRNVRGNGRKKRGGRGGGRGGVIWGIVADWDF